MRHRFLIVRIATTLCAAAFVGGAAWSQCSPYGTGARVDINYNAAPNGAFRLVENFNNFVADHNGDGVPERIRMADPTIILLNGHYYVTGTSDDFQTSNFAIYRSTNLYQWEFHSTVFPTASQSGHIITLNNNRQFRSLWAPQLFLAPGDNTNVWISFTASEKPTAGWNPTYDAIEGLTAFTATISRTRFEQGHHFADPTQNRAHEPMPYFYKVDNIQNGQVKKDGGYAQRIADGAWRTIPVSVDLNLLNPNCGDLEDIGGTYAHRCQGTWGAIALDSHVYFDPTQSNRRWLLYTWSVLTNPVDPNFQGNNIAAHPMLTNNVWLDALAPASEHIHLAHRAHQSHAPAGFTLNGYSHEAATPQYNVAWVEAPAAFRWNGWTYFTYSRNAWSSPAYGVYYRKHQGGIGSMAVGGMDTTTPESILVRSSVPAQARGHSYGHGEIFLGPGNKPYLIFHYKEAMQLQNGQWVHPSGGSGRTVFFKELTINNQTGDITMLSDWPGVCGQAAASRFLVPW